MGGRSDDLRALAGAGALVTPPMNHPTVGTHLDLDLLRIFRAATGKKGIAAPRTDALLGGQFGEGFTNRQVGIIPSLGTGVPRLLAPFPLRFLGDVFGIVQVVRAIAPRRRFGATPEKVGFELAFFTFELFDFLFQLGDALQGIAMATLPISDLLAEFEVLTLETLDLGAEVRDFLAQGPLPGSSTPRRSRSGDRFVPVGRP